jgi:hypothetical protein
VERRTRGVLRTGATVADIACLLIVGLFFAAAIAYARVAPRL